MMKINDAGRRSSSFTLDDLTLVKSDCMVAGRLRSSDVVLRDNQCVTGLRLTQLERAGVVCIVSPVYSTLSLSLNLTRAPARV